MTMGRVSISPYTGVSNTGEGAAAVMSSSTVIAPPAVYSWEAPTTTPPIT